MCFLAQQFQNGISSNPCKPEIPNPSVVQANQKGSLHCLPVVLISTQYCYCMLSEPKFFILYLFRCSGIRDDLNFLLEEDLTSINLCSLHCEMRNCEQLLGSLGLFAYRVGTLDKLNEALSEYGPENCRGFPRVTIKERKGQQTEIDRKNIKVASFSGMMSCKLRHLLKHY